MDMAHLINVIIYFINTISISQTNENKFQKLAKWLGIIIGVLALLVGGLVLYVWSQLPKADGEPPILQTELFQKPKTELPCEGKYILNLRLNLPH